MLSNGTMDEATRSQTAYGSISAPPPSPRVVPTSGIMDARERLGRLNGLLVEVQKHLEDQVSRISGPLPLCDDRPSACASYGGALGDLHMMIDALFETAERIGVPAARLDQI